MDQLLALTVAVPLLTAAAVSAARPLLGDRRRVLDAVAIGAAASVAVMLVIIMVRTAGGDQVYWFGGFRPARGIAIGIDFEAGSLSAGLASLAAVLVTAAMTFSWRYFERVATYYHALMLIFLAGMTGFCLTGDIFDMFVWFELMGVAAYALTAYRPEERGPLQGALNFAITNSVGAYLSLSGIAPDLRPHRSAQHGPDRRLHRPPPARRAGHGGVRAHHLGPADQERDRAVPLLARRRARGGADAGLRAALRRDGGTRPVRDRPGLLVDVRPGARSPGRDLARVPGLGRADRRGRGVVLFPRTAYQAAAGVLHHQPRGHVPGRHRPADAARPGRSRRLRGRPRPGQGGPVPVHRDRPAPARLCQRDLAAWPRPPPARHRRGLHARRLRAGRPPAVRHLPRQGLHRRERLGARAALGHGRVHRLLRPGRRGRPARGRRRVLRPG